LFEKLIDITSAAISTGRPVDDMRRDTLPIVAKMYRDSLPYSSRAALIRSARLMAVEFRALQTAPGKTCLQYAMTSDTAASNAAVKYFSREIGLEELEAMADAIETNDSARVVPRIEDVQPQLAEAVRIVEAKGGNDAAILAQLSEPDVDPVAACRAITAYFDALASLSPDQAEMALRATFGAK